MQEMLKDWHSSSKVAVSMLLVQAFATGMQLLAKLILNEGIFVFALMAYRHVVAALCVAPLAFFFERANLKKLSWYVWLWLFINALTGITMAMGLYYYGLRDTTATYATSFLNLIPIVTFAFSIILRIERLGLGSWAGKIKTLGAILCVAGALTTSLYTGKALHIDHRSHHQYHTISKISIPHSACGIFMLVGSCLCYAAWFVLQVKIHKVFPSKYWATMLTCIIASVQSVVIGLCLDRRQASWRLGWNLQLLTIIYSGALGTAATFCLLSWTIAKKGPTYPSMFNPLTIIFVAILEALILGQDIYIGTLLGIVMIIIGLYSFLWGKRKELKNLLEPNARSGETATTTVPESEGIQSRAIVIPISSPARSVSTDIAQEGQVKGIEL